MNERSDNWAYASEEEILEAIDAYEPLDPKSPNFLDMWMDAIDLERKREKESLLGARESDDSLRSEGQS
jgi:Fe-S-cluster formation regulator IscX/YfhJ